MPALNNYCVWVQGYEKEWRLIPAETPLQAAEKALAVDLGYEDDPWGRSHKPPIYCVEDEARKVVRFRVSPGKDGLTCKELVRPGKPHEEPATPLIDWIERTGGVN